MSVFDGSDDPATFGEVLVYMAERIPWGTEHQKTAAMRVIRAEFDMTLPEPEVPRDLQDSRDNTIRSQEAELAELRKRVELAELRKQAVEAERDAERAEEGQAAQKDPAEVPRDTSATPAAWADGADNSVAKPVETPAGGKKKG